MKGAELRVFVLMLKINLGIGIITLFGACYLIWDQMKENKKEKTNNEIAEKVSISG